MGAPAKSVGAADPRGGSLCGLPNRADGYVPAENRHQENKRGDVPEPGGLPEGHPKRGGSNTRAKEHPVGPSERWKRNR